MYLSFGENSLFLTKENEIATSLEITFEDLQIREVKASLTNHMMRFDALIGLKFIRERPLLLIATETRKVTTIGLSSANEIKNIGWVAVANESRQDAILKEVADELNEIQQVFVDGLHYYSELYDLSLPYVFNKIKAPDLHQRQYYNQFIWNANLTNMDGSQEKSAVRTFSRYCSRVVQGYMQEYATVLPNSEKARYILISRRSTKKAGTRFYARGIDDQGCVANFVETEQIVQMSELVFTHLQIRGSVPAFFAQTGVNGLASEMVIERTAPLTIPAFTKHFQSIGKMYQRIFAVNLLSDKKLEEKVLSNFYEQLVYTSKDTPFLRYQFYDFHEECKNNKFQNSEALIQKIEAVIDNFGFTCYDATQQTFLRQQSGVMRTNCLDCLDRTNYVQSRLALKSLRNFLLRFAGHETQELISQKKLLDLPVNEAFPLLSGFNSLWADNGDSISLLYTGIPSTHTDITRTGQRTLFGSVNHKFRSLMRFYTQFTDHHKQNAINSLVTPTSPRKNQSLLHDFHTTLAVSFAQTDDQEEVTDDVQRLILKQRPTLIVYFIFGKQQTSFFDKLRCYFKSDGLEIKAWVSTLEQCSQQHGYTMIGDLQSQFCWLGVFCRKEATQRVSQIKKENLTKSLSSGQALLIKMKLETSSFIFAGVNCSSLPQYLRVFDQIHEKGFQTSKLGQFKSTSLFELDYRVVLGNTGAKLKLSNEQIDRLREELDACKKEKDNARSSKIMDRILDADELNLYELRNRNKFIRQYNEGPVQFIPTGNRLLFWNQQGVILRVREYGGVGKGGLKAVLDYEIGRGRRQ